MKLILYVKWVDYLITKEMLQRYKCLQQLETFQILRYHQPLIIVKITPTPPPPRQFEKLKKVYASNIFWMTSWVISKTQSYTLLGYKVAKHWQFKNSGSKVKRTKYP